MASKLSASDKKDLDKFTKYLVFKCIQVIVQSRLGEKLQTDSKAFSSGSDWFNLTIKDSADVLTEAKKIYSNGVLAIGQYICVEISVKLSDGESMLLEIWWLSMTDQCDLNAHVSYTVYNRMSMMLRSALCVSRVTPAYQLSRKQGPDSYVICYRIYSGEPQMFFLGDGHQIAKVGSVPTPGGTIMLSVGYRTKMLISPQHSARDLVADLHDDHFTHEPIRKKASPGKPCIDRKSSLSSDVSFSTSPPPGHIPVQASPMTQQSKIISDEDAPTSLRAGAFASKYLDSIQLPPSESEAVPFMNLLLQSRDETNGDVSKKRHSVAPICQHNNDEEEEAESSPDHLSGSVSSKDSHCSTGDDFVIVPNLKAPFASSIGPADLNQFYQQCQTAPPLFMFEAASNDSGHNTMGSLSDQLAAFDASAKEFDDFINTLPANEL